MAVVCIEPGKAVLRRMQSMKTPGSLRLRIDARTFLLILAVDVFAGTKLACDSTLHFRISSPE
jgi:hypothetical protein